MVELITNADDSYRDIEDKGKHVSGKTRIEIERRKKGQPSTVIVRDRAGGMNREEMFNKLGKLGKRTSGFETGKLRRGLHGRGARDVAAFGVVHFESIKDEEYNHLIIPPSLKCKFTESRPKKVTEEIRKKLGIPRGNGTVVTIEVESRFTIPQHETLIKDFSRYYSLRDLFSDARREVVLVDLNKNRGDPLRYTYPTGEVVFNKGFSIPGYSGVTAHLVIRKHTSSFEQGTLPYREGILIKSAAAIHDCTYLGLESEPFSWRFTGELYCEIIDNLIREYDDREEANPDNPKHPENNPIRLLDPFRDGLILEHPFSQKLYKKCKEILRPFIEELKATEAPPKRSVTDENLERKLDNLSKEISKVFEKKLTELEEEIPTGDIDDPRIKKLSIGLHIIPPGEIPIIVDQPKTFSIVVKHYEALDESLPVDVVSSDPDNIKIRTSPVFLKKFSEDKKVGTTTFTVEGSKIETEAFIEVRYDGYDNLMLVNVIEAPPIPEVPDGLSFEKPQYHLQINKEKTLILRLKPTAKLDNQIQAEIISDHPAEIVVKGGGKCLLRETDNPMVLAGNCKIVGRQLKTKGSITARVKGFEPVHTRVIVEEREPRSGIDFKRPKPVDDYFGGVRYKWDDKELYLLLIAARHPSISRYLGEPIEQVHPGINSPLYHAVLAEVIAEALTFRILEKQFIKEGQEGMLDYTSTDSYYHRHFSEFLTITHKHLVTV
ncbi:MAG: hypothetical protein AB1401_14245 [Thermodesulfobacteriota bacterium]